MYLAEIDFPRSMDKIEQLVSTLENSTDIIKSVDSWYPAFKEFSNSNLNSNIPDEPLDNATFNADLTQFLYNADLNTLGLRFIPNFQSNEGEIVCGEPAPNILLSTFTFKHIKFNGRDEHIPALNKVKKIIDDCHFDGLVFPFNQVEKFIIFYCFQISFSRLFKSIYYTGVLQLGDRCCYHEGAVEKSGNSLGMRVCNNTYPPSRYPWFNHGLNHSGSKFG